MDVTSLMKTAADRGDAERESKEIIRESAHCSFMESVVRSISGSNPSSISASSGNASPATGNNRHQQSPTKTRSPDLHRPTGSPNSSSETSTIESTGPTQY